MKHKVIITEDQDTINSWLLSGIWTIESITPQRVAVGGESPVDYRGKFCFVLKTKS